MKKNLPSLPRIAAFFVVIISCFITGAFAQHNPLLGAGNGYVNLSKRTTGGAVQTGDTLEIRTVYFFKADFAGTTGYNPVNNSRLFKFRYYDSVPLKTSMNTGTSDRLRIITNEGLPVQSFTLGAGDDAGVFNPVPGTGYQIRINIGTGAGNPGTGASNLTNIINAGDITGTYTPNIWGNTLITTAFRVTVTGNPGDTIVLGAGKLVYRKTSSGIDTTITAVPYKILIDATASALCSNGLGNNLALEASGTFDSGLALNRSYGPAFSIPNYDYLMSGIGNSINDGAYAIVKNTSPSGSVNTNARRQPNCSLPAGPIPVTDSCAKRMHGGFWEIMGDHTGTSNSIGNPPAAPGTRGGYMLMVNADNVTSEAYRQNVTGLCTDTYYEFSAWFKNICKTCGANQSSSQTFLPGVRPNLTLAVNGLDIYSSGEIDTVGWIKKGFVFKTGVAQTSALISIRNNAPGGGGNDWVMDDISIGTCGPSSTMNYKPVALACTNGATFTFADTIRYTYNPKYSYYKWERSTNNGASWSVPPQSVSNSGNVTIGPPVNGFYQFVTEFGPISVNGTDSGHLYRVVVGTNAPNLASTSCNFTDGNSIMVKVITCPPVLSGKIVSFTGKLKDNDKTVLNWVISNEIDVLKYEIEKSSDGVNFIKTGDQVSGSLAAMAEYYYNDKEIIKGNTYFRLKIYNTNGLYNYSKVIVVNHDYNFQVTSLVNPFNSGISSVIILPGDGLVKMSLYNSYGKLVATENRKLYKGLNSVQYNGWYALSSGMYFISFQYNNLYIQRKLTRLNY